MPFLLHLGNPFANHLASKVWGFFYLVAAAQVPDGTAILVPLSVKMEIIAISGLLTYYMQGKGVYCNFSSFEC